MPNWKIHLEVAKKVNKELKYDGKNLELFLLGNILPDINNGHVVMGISKKLSHTQTHFRNDIDKTYINFYNEYKSYFNNPLIVGYFVHLYTDYHWTKDYRNKINKISGYDNYTKEERMALKHNDFKVYNNNFIDNVLNLINYDLLIDNIDLIKEVSITKNDLILVNDFLNNQKECSNKFKFYNNNELDLLLDRTVIKLNKILGEITNE